MEDDLRMAENDIKKYEDAQKDMKQLDGDIKKYDNEIKSQQERLSKLEKEEEKELNKTGEEVSKLIGKIGNRNDSVDNDDGKINKKALNKNEKDAGKLDGLQARQKELQRKSNYTKLYNKPGENIGGKTFRTGSYDGETLYMIGAKNVTEEEYNEALKKAKEQNQ